MVVLSKIIHLLHFLSLLFRPFGVGKIDMGFYITGIGNLKNSSEFPSKPLMLSNHCSICHNSISLQEKCAFGMSYQ